MKQFLNQLMALLIVAGLSGPWIASNTSAAEISEETQACLDCHVSATPAIVQDWKRSRHAKVTPGEAIKKPELERRISVEKITGKSAGFVVGCAECHTLNAENHKDTFDHNGQKVHLLVTPKDCAVCHPTESEQYEKNLMSHARVNLVDNKVFWSFVNAVNGVQTFKDMKVTRSEADEETNADSCFHCHGTAVEVKGKEKRDSDFGEMEFPVLSGWPNQGVGRFNTDGSKGTCTPCHSRHQFALQVARKPYVCSQCHKGPDVPAYKAYSVSKHGNLFAAVEKEWDFTAVPWTVGKDFVAPTCATCHVSLLVTPEGDTVASRTHQMNDRLPVRILGLIYAHPHPKSPDTSIIRNKDGLPLPTTLTGEPASEFLIGPEEQAARRTKLQKVCRSCHSKDWVDGHWRRFENTIRTTDEMTLTATRIMLKAWEEKLADNSNLFDESIEKEWVQQWLFYANSTRFASAMMGADYGVFANGRWYLGKTIQDLLEHYSILNMNQNKKR